MSGDAHICVCSCLYRVANIYFQARFSTNKILILQKNVRTMGILPQQRSAIRTTAPVKKKRVVRIRVVAWRSLRQSLMYEAENEDKCKCAAMHSAVDDYRGHGLRATRGRFSRGMDARTGRAGVLCVLECVRRATRACA